MEFDERARKYHQIIFPGCLEDVMSVQAAQKRFVSNTSADIAMKVLRQQELWFRNAAAMTDCSDTSSGLGLIRTVFAGGLTKALAPA